MEKAVRPGGKKVRKAETATEHEDMDVTDCEEFILVDRKNRELEKREKKRKKREEEEQAAKNRRETERRENLKKFPPLPKTDAVVIKTTQDRSFSDVFKKLKEGAGDKLSGIQTIRKSRGGDLVIELGKQTKTEAFAQIVRDTLGEIHPVRKLTPKITYELKDIDPTLEREEIRIETAKALGNIDPMEIEIRSVRFSFAGTKTAIIALPAENATKIGENNRISIGYTICRLKKAINIVRCFKCHDLGHLSYVCPDKGKNEETCRRCGLTGHQINGCGAIKQCKLCIKQGVPAAKAEHIAGAANCPQ